jgi:hypothetical protein
MSSKVVIHSSFLIAHSSFAVDSFASLGMTKTVRRIRYNDNQDADGYPAVILNGAKHSEESYIITDK